MIYIDNTTEITAKSAGYLGNAGSNTLPSAQLTCADIEIRDKGEMLSLTDIWKAAGSVEAQKPYEWLRQDATKAFVECVTASLEEGRTLFQTKKSGRAMGGSIFAHWQIAIAYAKYLPPEFQM